MELVGITLLTFAGIICGTLLVSCCIGWICCCTNPLCLVAAIGGAFRFSSPKRDQRASDPNSGYGAIEVLPPPRVHSQPLSSYFETGGPRASKPLDRLVDVEDAKTYDPHGPRAPQQALEPSAPQIVGCNPYSYDSIDREGRYLYSSQAVWHEASGAQERPYRQQRAFYRDLWALILFLLNVGMLVAIAVRLGLPAVGILEKEFSDRWRRTHISAEQTTAATNLLLTCLLLAVAGALLALTWLQMILRWTKGVSWIGVHWPIAVSAALAVGGVILNNTAVFFSAMVFFFFAYCVLYTGGRKTILSSTNLGLSCDILLRYPSIITCSYAFVLVHLSYAAVWTVAALGVWALLQSGDANRPLIHSLLAYMLLSLYWGQQIIENVLRCTVVGVVVREWRREEWKGSNMFL